MRPNSSCAAPMSMTASAVPPAATLPAICTSRRCAPICSVTRCAVSPSAVRVAALRKTWPGAKSEKRAAPSAGTGISAGASVGSTSASTPTMRSGRRRSPSTAVAAISTTGLASATCGCRATRANKVSSKLPCAARSSRSGWPLTERTALENSSSAEALMRCTEKASATPSITATTAAALRHG